MDITKQNLPHSKNNNFEDTLYINKGIYEEVFFIITLLTKKYIVPNIDTLPEKSRFVPSTFYVEIGKKYRKRHNLETLYFFPEGFVGAEDSFISQGSSGPSFWELKEILDDLYLPQQILSDFYKTLMTFAKNNKQQIKGLKLPLQFLKTILENEEEYKS